MIFDIETVPLERALAAPYPTDRTPPANYKSEEAIAKWYATDEASWREQRVKECSLNPRLGRVVMLGLAFGDAAPLFYPAETEGDERGLLEEFWRTVGHSRLVGFNSHGFDFPFLLTRSLILGVAPGIDVTGYLRRYSYTPHLDVRMALTGWDSRQTGTLADWCEAFGVECPEGHGSEVYAAYRDGDFASIAQHCVADVAATGELARRIEAAFP